MQDMQETWGQSLGQKDSPRGGNGNLLQYSCLENPMDSCGLWDYKELNWPNEHIHKQILCKLGVSYSLIPARESAILIRLSPPR